MYKEKYINKERERLAEKDEYTKSQFTSPHAFHFCQRPSKATNISNSMMKASLEDKKADIDAAFQAINSYLHNFVCEEDFLEVQDEFRNSDQSIELFYYKLDKGEIDQEKFYTFKEILGYSDKTLIHCYNLAKDLFNDQLYAEATQIFSLLTLLYPVSKPFWLAKGVCQNSWGDYATALQTFEEADKNHPNDPEIHLHMVHTFIKIGNKEKAKNELTKAIEVTKSIGESEKWEHSIEALKQEILRMRENSDV